MMIKAKKIIELLKLTKHPEGGYYRQVYRSNEEIDGHYLPKRFNGSRSFSTSIYFLLTSDCFSAFHKINQDEGWHFYQGSPLNIHMIDEKGHYSSIQLGHELEKGQRPQFIVPAGCFFGASVINKDSFSLVGCTVAPGFEFDDFLLPNTHELLVKFPQHEAIIKRLSRK